MAHKRFHTLESFHSNANPIASTRAREVNLESLANELLLNVFEFLNTIPLLRAFYGLNARFDALVFTHLEEHGLDFQSVSKHNFNIICRQYLPSISERIISLRLSDDDETPQQTNLFLDHGLSLRQFTQLKSLSLTHLRSQEIMTKLMLEWCHLPHFTHLTFISCYFRCDYAFFIRLVNSIWSLPKLTYCNLDITYEYGVYFPTPMVISSSLERLFISGVKCHLDYMDRLFEHTPCLQHLSITFDNQSGNENLACVVPSINMLKVCYHYQEPDTIRNFLRNMPNLCQLTIEMINMHMNGQQWEQIIRNHLPKLKIFQFRLVTSHYDSHNKEQEVTELVASFRNSFWLDEHQWFVQCDWNPEKSYSPIHLYTLPYAFKDFDVHYPTQSKSTSPQTEDRRSYNRVRLLNYNIHTNEKWASSYHHCYNIRILSTILPFTDQFLSFVPRLDQLISLEISRRIDFLFDFSEQNSMTTANSSSDNHDANILSNLQSLFDRAYRLYSIKVDKFSSSILSQMSPSMSIRRLNLQNFGQWFNNQQCSTLSHSSLGVQCEVLVINVENRTCITDLVNTMINLRALNVRCQDDEETWDEDSFVVNDKLVIWLRHRLPSTCTITRDIRAIYHVRLWIR